ncbi:MAG: hypothetical protein OXI87_11405 [Albidovulum sp.]|nr:hypothetical protein [Albidovulum sp.]
MKCQVEERPQSASIPNGIAWTNEEIRILVEEWKRGIGFKKIGKLIGRSRKSVAVKASRIGLTTGLDSDEVRNGNAGKNGKLRNCLSCSALFYSTGFGNRLCNKCKNSSAWDSGGDCTEID